MRQPCATSRIQLHDVDLTVRFRKRRWDFLSSELRSSITASNLSTICSQYVSVFACCSRFKLAARQIVEQFRSRPMGLFALLRFENPFCIFCIFFIVDDQCGEECWIAVILNRCSLNRFNMRIELKSFVCNANDLD